MITATAFWNFVKKNDLKAMQQALADGFHPDCYNDEMERPLHYACKTGNMEMMQMLLDYGAHNGRKRKDKSTPLTVAIRALYTVADKEKQYKIIEKLLETDSALNCGTTNNEAPIMEAIRINDERSIDILLKIGANVERRNVLGQTALTLASCFGSVETISKIMAQASSFSKIKTDKSGKTALMYAAEFGNEEVLKFFLKTGCFDVNDKMKQGTKQNTALLFAVENGHLNIVKTLLAAGADANLHQQMTHYEKSPLLIALCKEHYQIAKLLFPHTSLNHKYKIIPLVAPAVYSDSQEIVDLVIEAGDKIGFKNVRDYLFLEAVNQQRIEMTDYFLKKGADINAKHACLTERPTALILAIWEGNRQVIDFLLQQKPDVNIQTGKQKLTALITAVLCEDTKTVEALLQQKADTQKTDAQGLTALAYARVSGNKEILDMLEKHEKYLKDLEKFRQRMAARRSKSSREHGE